MKRNLLILGDSPTVNTGFANVVRNLAARWRPAFDRLDLWGINYNGWPHEYPYRIYPAGFNDWNGAAKLSQFLNLLLASDYTHVFFLCDGHNLTGEFAVAMREVADKKHIHFTVYYPVDAPLEKPWLDLVACADAAATYTEYGRRETARARPGLNPEVIPHGVDQAVFYPRADRASLRQQRFGGWVKPDDFLILNVNRNERRKAPHHSLQILKRLRDRGVPAKLFLHMPNVSTQEGTNLELVARQFGLTGGEWSHNDEYFTNGHGLVTESGLNELYNCADLVLSTSLGEGWGLSITEGLAAGAKVAVPDHTSCAEIFARNQKLGHPEQMIRLPLANEAVINMLDTSRVRYPVNVEAAAERIQAVVKTPRCFAMTDPMSDWLSWDRIAADFLNQMKIRTP